MISQLMQKKHLTKSCTLSDLKKKTTLSKPGMEVSFLSVIKVMCKKPTAVIILRGKRFKSFPLRSETRPGCPLFPLWFTFTGSSSSYERRRNIKMYPGCFHFHLKIFYYKNCFVHSCSMQDLSSSTRDWTHAPCSISVILTAEPPGKSQSRLEREKNYHVLRWLDLTWRRP